MPCFLNARASSFETVRVLDRDDAVEQLDDRRVTAKSGVHARKLDTDGTRTHNDHRLRHALEFEDVIGINDLFAVGLKTRDRTHDRAGRDNDVLGVDRLLFAVGERDLDLALADDLAKAVIDRGLVLFHQVGHAGGVFGDDVRFVFLNGRPVIAELFHL